MIDPEAPMARELADVIAWLVAAWLIERTNAIELGLLVTLGSFLFAAD